MIWNVSDQVRLQSDLVDHGDMGHMGRIHIPVVSLVRVMVLRGIGGALLVVT